MRKNNFPLLQETWNVLNKWKEDGVVGKYKIILALAEIKKDKEIYKFVMKKLEEAIDLFD